MNHKTKRISAALMAAVMVLTLLPLGSITLTASAASAGDIYSDTDTRIVGALDQNVSISLPITIRDYDNDGMLFEYAENSVLWNGNSSSSTTLTRTVPVASTIAAPVTATGYNAEQGENFAGPAGNATVSYGTDDGRYYHLVHGDGSTSGQVGAGLGARFRINYKAGRYNAGATQYVAIRYRVASTSSDPTDGNSTLTASILGSTYQSSAGTFTEIRPDNCVRADFDLNSDGQWHEVIVNMADFVSSTPYYASYPNYISWASTLNFYSYYFALEYNENLGEAVDVAYVAFFPTKAQAQAYINQADCYREDVQTIEYTVPAGTPEAAIGVDVRSGDSFDGYGSSVDCGVSYYFTDEGGRFWGVSDTKKGGYGVGLKALLLKNVYNRFGATMDDIRYVAIRYRASSTGYEDGAQIPLYLFAENQSLGYYNKDDFMDHSSTTTDPVTGETTTRYVPYFSNRLSTFTRFYATNDGEWQTAVVDFADYVSQYPTGEGYYYQPYDGTDLVGRIGIADERALMYNDIDISYIAFFSDKADAQAYNDQYAAYLNGSLEATTATYTAQMTDTTESRTYLAGNNRQFGLYGPGTIYGSSYGYYDYTRITSMGYDGIGTVGSNASLASYGLSAKVGASGGITVGLAENSLQNGRLTYRQDTVAYLAGLLQHTLVIPESYNNRYANNYVAGEPDGAKYGWYDDAHEDARDYAGFLRYALGITNADGSWNITGTDQSTDAKRLSAAANLNGGSGILGSYAETAAKAWTFDWQTDKDQIETCFDAAYFMLNSIFSDGGVSRAVPEYKYLTMVQETDPVTHQSYYVFDGGYTNVSYDYATGVIGNTSQETVDINGTNVDLSENAIKPYYYYTAGNTTTYYPFLPITQEMNEFRQTDTPYFSDEGVQQRASVSGTYEGRDYNYVMEGHGKFYYNAEDNLYFNFEGDDDVYLFINGQLVLDIGGAHGITEETVNINDCAASIGLEDGGIYDFDFFYMERHGFGANIRIETNINIVNEDVTVNKGAEQNGTPIDDYSVIDSEQPLSYWFSVTNNSDNTLYNQYFNDVDIGCYVGYDMSTTPNDTYANKGLGSYTDAGGTVRNRSVSDLTVQITNSITGENLTYHPQTLAELKELLRDLDYTAADATAIANGTELSYGRGLRPGDTLTVSGVLFMLPEDLGGRTFTNTVYAAAGPNPGIGTLHIIGDIGNPVYYMWAGHTLTVPLSEMLTEAGASWSSGTYRCLADGTAFNGSDAVISGSSIEFRYTTTGIKHCYFTSANNAADPIHVTVYVYDTKDNTFVLDYGLPADLTGNDKTALTANDTLTLSGNATTATWEAFTATAPTYNAAANRIESTDWELPSSGGKSFLSGKQKEITEETEVQVPYEAPAESYSIGYHIDEGDSFNAVNHTSNGSGSYVGTGAGRYYHMAPNDKGYDMGFRVRAYGSNGGTVKVSNANYVAFRYRVSEGSTSEDFHVLLGTSYAGAAYPANQSAYRADITLPADGEWHTATLCISDNLVPKYDTSASVYLSSWDATKTVKEIWLGTGYNDTKTVDIGYVAFFGSQAEADAYNTAYMHYLNGDTYTDVQTVTTDLTPDEGTAIGYSIADGKYFNNSSSTASGTAIMNGTLTYAAESTNNPAYAEVISSANSGDTGYGFGARTLVWADNVSGVSGSRLQVVAIRYRVAEYAGGDCSLGVLATRTKSSGTSISTTTAAPAGAKFAANTDGEWHTEYVVMGQSPYAQSTYKNYAGTTSYNYSSFGTSYTYYQLFVGQQWVSQNKIDYAYVLGFDSLAAAQAYDAAFDSFYYQPNPATGTEAGTVNPTGLTGSYGTYAGSLENASLIFTPDMFLNGATDIYLTVRVSDAEFDGSDKMSDIDYHHEVEMFQKITVVPASVMYYENDFPAIDYDEENVQNTIDYGTASAGMQDADQAEAYGHDNGYEAGDLESSAGSDTVITSTGGEAFRFSFTGTGFEIVSRIADAASATLEVRVYDNENRLVYDFPVITEYDNDGDDAGGEKMYQVPVISFNDLDYGDYTVVVNIVSAQDYNTWQVGYDAANNWVYYTDGTDYWKSIYNTETYATEYAEFLSAYTPGTAYTGSFGTATATSPAAKQSTLHVDGIRIYNPLTAEDAARYYPANEAGADIVNVRELIADGKIAFAEYQGSDLLIGTDAYTFVENRNNVLSDDVTALTGNEVTGAEDYLKLGPNDETYLNGLGKTQGIVLYVKQAATDAAARTLQIAAHRIDETAAQADGTAGNVTLTAAYIAKDGSVIRRTLKASMTSGTEQYYTLSPEDSAFDSENGYFVLITADNGLISLSNIKYKGYTFTDFTEGFTDIEPWGDPTQAPEAEAQKRTIFRLMKNAAVVLVPDEQPAEPEAQIKIKSAYLKLDEDIDILFTAELPAGYRDPYMTFTWHGETQTVTDYTVDENGLYCFEFAGVTPQCMGDGVTATVFAAKDREIASDTVSDYSVRTYCANLLSRTEDGKLITLLSDLLTYGACAQRYTDYETDTLVTEDLDLSPSTFTAPENKAVSFNGTADADTDWTAASLVLQNSPAVRFEFAAASTEGLSVEITVNGKTQTFTEFTPAGEGRFSILFRGIMATEFDDAVTATFCRNGEPFGRSVSYSVNTYICAMQNNTAVPHLAQLVQALYNYGAAAQAYAG